MRQGICRYKHTFIIVHENWGVHPEVRYIVGFKIGSWVKFYAEQDPAEWKIPSVERFS